MIGISIKTTWCAPKGNILLFKHHTLQKMLYSENIVYLSFNLGAQICDSRILYTVVDINHWLVITLCMWLLAAPIILPDKYLIGCIIYNEELRQVRVGSVKIDNFLQSYPICKSKLSILTCVDPYPELSSKLYLNWKM